MEHKSQLGLVTGNRLSWPLLGNSYNRPMKLRQTPGPFFFLRLRYFAYGCLLSPKDLPISHRHSSEPLFAVGNISGSFLLIELNVISDNKIGLNLSPLANKADISTARCLELLSACSLLISGGYRSQAKIFAQIFVQSGLRPRERNDETAIFCGCE